MEQWKSAWANPALCRPLLLLPLLLTGSLRFVGVEVLIENATNTCTAIAFDIRGKQSPKSYVAFTILSDEMNQIILNYLYKSSI